MSIPVIEELRAFTGLPEDEIWRRLNGGIHRTAESYRESTHPDDWYRHTDAYLFELANYDEDPLRDSLAQVIAGLFDGVPLRVLEYGCGIGTFTLMLAHRGVRVTACDINQPNLKFLRFRVERRALTELVEIASPEDALCRPDYYAVVSCQHVLEHVEDPKAMLENFKAALQRGGLFFGVAPFDLIGELFPEHRVELAHLRLDTLCADVGFRDIQVIPFGQFNDSYEFNLVSARKP